MHSVTYMYMRRCLRKSIAIQEAQILGCTLLVSDCSGNREQVIDGVDGKMCQLTPEGISAGIEELLSDEEKCREYGKKASEKLTAEKKMSFRCFGLTIIKMCSF